MKNIVCFLISIFPFVGVCQEGVKPERRVLSIGLIFSPAIAYRQLNYSSSNQWIADVRNDKEIPKFGFTAGGILHLRLKNNLKLQMGLLYSNKGEKTKPQELIWTSANPDFPIKSQVIYHYQFIEIPARINYTFFATDRLSLFASAGLSFDVLISKKTKVKLEFPDGNTDSHASSRYIGDSKFNIFGAVGFGCIYRVSEKINVVFEPIFQRSITSIAAHEGASEYLYSVDFTVGIVKRLKDKK